MLRMPTDTPFDALRDPSALARPVCFALDQNRTADCQALATGDQTHQTRSTAANYPPFYYLLIGWPTLVVTGLLAAAIWAADLAASALGAKVSGASRWAVIGATVGLVVGLFLGPFGIVLGPVAGAAVFEYWQDPDLEKALKAGGGTLLGFLAGSVVKVMLAFLLLAVLLVGLMV